MTTERAADWYKTATAEEIAESINPQLWHAQRELRLADIARNRACSHRLNLRR